MLATQGGSEKNCVTVNRLVIEDQAFGLQPVGHTVSAERLFSGRVKDKYEKKDSTARVALKRSIHCDTKTETWIPD